MLPPIPFIHRAQACFLIRGNLLSPTEVEKKRVHVLPAVAGNGFPT